MHLLHKLGNAKTEANYHAYYQTLIKDGTSNGATSNAYLTAFNVPKSMEMNMLTPLL